MRLLTIPGLRVALAAPPPALAFGAILLCLSSPPSGRTRPASGGRGYTNV